LSSLVVPIIGVAAAWVQLGERPTLLEGLGIGLILAALGLLALIGRASGTGAPEGM
jgi:drug/metabolite transporter (DMT)-like permease